MNFEALLTLVTSLTGLSYGLSKFLENNQNGEYRKYFSLNKQVASFFPTLLLILFTRSFVIEPFRIPSGSQKPNLLVGDFVLAYKFSYGFRLPVLGTLIAGFKAPTPGEIAVFRFPLAPSTYFIKRMIGGPKDRIHYHSKTITLNDQIAKQRVLGVERDEESNGHYWPVLLKEENLAHHKHRIYIRLDLNHSLNNPIRVPTFSDSEAIAFSVPEKHYFFMGDNRDNSFDSRHWGFVPEKYLVGKAKWIFFSWNSQASWKNPWHWVRWERIGMKIN